jgi:hypothetical protein
MPYGVSFATSGANASLCTKAGWTVEEDKTTYLPGFLACFLFLGLLFFVTGFLVCVGMQAKGACRGHRNEFRVC